MLFEALQFLSPVHQAVVVFAQHDTLFQSWLIGGYVGQHEQTVTHLLLGNVLEHEQILQRFPKMVKFVGILERDNAETSAVLSCARQQDFPVLLRLRRKLKLVQ